MELTWGGLVVVVVAAIIAWFWQDSLRVRDLANIAAMSACTQLGLQFLDGTVAFTRLRIRRLDGKLRLQRSYVFDYTAQSIDRLQGFVVLHGLAVESVGFAPDSQQRIATAQPVVSQPPAHFVLPSHTSISSPPPAVNDDAKVLDLEKWRRTRHSRQ